MVAIPACSLMRAEQALRGHSTGDSNDRRGSEENYREEICPRGLGVCQPSYHCPVCKFLQLKASFWHDRRRWWYGRGGGKGRGGGDGWWRRHIRRSFHHWRRSGGSDRDRSCPSG